MQHPNVYFLHKLPDCQYAPFLNKNYISPHTPFLEFKELFLHFPDYSLGV